MSKPINRKNDSCREKIQTSQLLNRLQDSVIGDEPKELTTNQLSAIKILLSKTLPDLSSVAYTDSDGNNLPPPSYTININGVEKK